MKVESKYDKGNTIFFMDGENPTKRIVTGITFFTGKRVNDDGTYQMTENDEVAILYHVDGVTRPINEDVAYGNKEDLIKAKFDAL